jgi:diaphanous 1
MHGLPTDRKQYLLHQNREFRSAASPTRLNTHGSQPAYAASYGPSSAAAFLPRLVPQLTGDAGLMRRFSITGWGTGGPAPPVVSADSNRSSGEFDAGGSDAKGKVKAQVEKVAEEMSPIKPQSTGGLWSSWWASSGGEKGATSGEKGTIKETAKSAKSYVDGIRVGRTTDIKLVKLLISLRVHLSTAKLVWIEEFVREEKGLDVLGTLLAGLVGKGGKRRDLSEVETTVLLEVIKCLRVLLNTDVRNQSLGSSPFSLILIFSPGLIKFSRHLQ